MNRARRRKYAPGYVPPYIKTPLSFGLIRDDKRASPAEKQRNASASNGIRDGTAHSRTQRGISVKDGYPPKISSPPSPEMTALSPSSRAALLTNQVLTPSIVG